MSTFVWLIYVIALILFLAFMRGANRKRRLRADRPYAGKSRTSAYLLGLYLNGQLTDAGKSHLDIENVALLASSPGRVIPYNPEHGRPMKFTGIHCPDDPCTCGKCDPCWCKR